jgi:hypothetical protein
LFNNISIIAPLYIYKYYYYGASERFQAFNEYILILHALCGTISTVLSNYLLLLHIPASIYLGLNVIGDRRIMQSGYYTAIGFLIYLSLKFLFDLNNKDKFNSLLAMINMALTVRVLIAFLVFFNLSSENYYTTAVITGGLFVSSISMGNIGPTIIIINVILWNLCW